MKIYWISIICILLLFSCSSPNHKEEDVLNASIQYEHYLNDYYNGGDVSDIDSALKYNALLLESDSASIVQYLNQIQLLYFCSRYDSILSFVNRIPEDMVSWVPEYKTYLRLKCAAVIANGSGNASRHRDCLDSIIVFWEPVILDSIAKSDSIFSKSFDSIPSNLWFMYENYYEILSLRHGKDSVNKILSYKKKKFNWNSETYTIIKQSTNGDAGLSLP